LTEPFITFASGVQALRRRTEALTWGLGGALGVAADPYPHQIGTVHRILTEIRIRHLIADEVGLGKTVQALMIMNALRWQQPKHRTVIVAPERLTKQWMDETWTRGHVKAAVVGSEQAERTEQPPVLIVRPRDIQDRPSVLDPLSHSLLIVDEPQSIPLDVMRRIAALSSGLTTTESVRFRQVLILSATPRLSDPRWRNVILEMLEPERTGIAALLSLPILDYLGAIEAEGLAGLNGIDPADLAKTGDFAFRTKAVTRRISRQTRSDWGKYLPQRRNHVVRFEPTGSETQRLDLMAAILKRHPDKTDLSAYPWSNIKEMLRSRRSARAALDKLTERLGLSAIELARTLSLEDPGDSRFEALLDVLSTQWSERPDERFIIVAGDAPTIDMLAAALPRYIPELAGEGAIAALKRPPSATEETASDIQQMHETVEPFTSGDARILLLGDWVQAGLNLHHTAQNIIFYSLPWDPQAVDQLIGRVDRLRRKGLHKGRQGYQIGKVHIWRLLMRHSPEEAISDAMDAIRLFERPLPQISEDDSLIVDTHLGLLARNQNVHKSLEALEAAAALWDAGGLISRLDDFDPVTAQNAERLSASLGNAARVEPSMAIVWPDSSVFEQAEAANKGWVKMLEGAGLFQIGHRRDKDNFEVQFQTIWYPHRQAGQPFALTEVGTDNWMTDHAAFLVERRRLSSPPRTTVITDDGEQDGRLLRFFDHGESIHDDIVTGFRKLCDAQFQAGISNHELRVRIAEGHPALAFATKTLLLSVGYAEPARALDCTTVPARLQAMVDDSATEAQRARLNGDILEFLEDIQADQRWLQRLLPPALVLCASVLEGGAWVAVESDIVPMLFKPLGEDGKFRPVPRSLPPTGNQAPLPQGDRGRSLHASSISNTLNLLCKQAYSTAGNDVQSRLSLISHDAMDMIDLRKRQWDNRKTDAVGEAQRDLLRGQVIALEKRLLIATAAVEERRKRLLEGVIAGAKRKPDQMWHLLVRFIAPTV
jgi:ATP-dependent helicase HepA